MEEQPPHMIMISIFEDNILRPDSQQHQHLWDGLGLDGWGLTVRMEILQGSQDKAVIESLLYLNTIRTKTNIITSLRLSFIAIAIAIVFPILFSVYLLQYFEDFNEKIDDVQIELNGSQDVFLGAESGHDHLQDGS